MKVSISFCCFWLILMLVPNGAVSGQATPISLEGTWRVVSVEDQKGKVGSEEKSSLRGIFAEALEQGFECKWVFGKDRFFLGLGEAMILSGTYETNKHKTPITIDLKALKLLGNQQCEKEVMKGIIKGDGKNLSISVGNVGGERPRDFVECKKGNGVCITLRKKEGH